MTDSAGTPWAGRRFEPNPGADDDGSADPGLIEAIARFRGRLAGEVDVIDAVRGTRLLVPLIAELGEAAVTDAGLVADKTQELSIVTVAGPDGRAVLPAFTSVGAMRAWNPAARPVPASAERVALAAADDATELVVLDPTSDTEFAIRRPAIRALAQGEDWTPSYLDEAVLAAFMRSAEPEPHVLAVQLAPGDPRSRLEGPELIVHLTLAPGLSATELEQLTRRLTARWSADEIVAHRVDSLRLALVGAVR